MPSWWSDVVGALVLALLGLFLRDHGKRISGNETKADSLGKTVAELQKTQEACQKNMTERLARGDDYMEALGNSIKLLETSSAQICEASKAIKDQVKTMDDRIYELNRSQH